MVTNTEIQSGIYRFVNLVNGKSYIGRAKDLNHRRLEHLRFLRNGNDPCLKLDRAWKKYGEENFAYEILCYCDVDELDQKEQEYISLYNSFHDGYNCTIGGGGILGFRHTEETKKRIGDASRGKPLSEEQRKLLSDLQKGRPLTEDHKKALRNAWTPKRKQWMTDTRSGKNNPNFGKCGANACNKRAVVASTGEFFYTVRSAAVWCGQKTSCNIVTCCRGKCKTAGKHPITNERLSWRYASNEEVQLHKHTT